MGRQIAMVIDLNKCIGCQSCTVACKTLWTSGEGLEHVLFNNVETKPGPGYPHDWENAGGGIKNHKPVLGKLLDKSAYGGEKPLNFEQVYFNGEADQLKQSEPMGYGSNWDEDTSSGDYPNNYHFYLPRLCNHCTNPACLKACPTQAIYKREEDGIVVLDEDKCAGFRKCNQACPYKKVYFNFVTKKSTKCIFCFPRIEQGVAPACARQCPGRLRFVGFLEDENGPIHKLVNQWKVALPLHPEYGTEPNVYYIPPILAASFDQNGDFSENPRVPISYLRYLFGERVDESLITILNEMERRKSGQKSELMDLLIAKDWKELFGIPVVKYA